MDANSNLGKKMIADDPKEQSENGTILAGLIEHHALCVANSLTTKRKKSYHKRNTHHQWN